MSLRLQLMGAFAYVLVLILVALEVPLALNLARRIDAEVKNEAAAQAVVVAANASGRMNRPQALAKVARDAGRDLGGRVIVVDRRGRLLADSTIATAPRPLPYASRPEIRIALGGGRAQGERHSDTLAEDLLYTAVPVTNNGRVVGVARVTQSIEAVHDRVRRGVLALVAIGGFALLVGLGVAWLLANSLSKPLRSLAGTARRVEAGDLEARAEEVGPTGQLKVAAAFNDMTDRLGTVLPRSGNSSPTPAPAGRRSPGCVSGSVGAQERTRKRAGRPARGWRPAPPCRLPARATGPDRAGRSPWRERRNARRSAGRRPPSRKGERSSSSGTATRRSPPRRRISPSCSTT